MANKKLLPRPRLENLLSLTPTSSFLLLSHSILEILPSAADAAGYLPISSLLLLLFFLLLLPVRMINYIVTLLMQYAFSK